MKEEISKTIAPFVQVHDVDKLLPILKCRLPQNSQVHNSLLLFPNFRKEMKIFYLNPITYEEDLSSDVWIFVVYERHDVPQDVSISAPLDTKITSELRNALENTRIFDWTLPYFFSAIDRSVSPLIYDISIHKGNATHVYPCYFYYCPKEVGLALNWSHDDEVELRPLELTYGPEFLNSTWHHASEGSLEYVKQSIERNITSGVYTKGGRPISGILTVGAGVMGLLYTDKAYRNKNYGKLCMQNLMKTLTLKGFSPCSCVEIFNEPSIKFHAKIGMKKCSVVDYIRYNGPAILK